MGRPKKYNENGWTVSQQWDVDNLPKLDLGLLLSITMDKLKDFHTESMPESRDVKICKMYLAELNKKLIEKGIFTTPYVDDWLESCS